jgi:8-oxo-dGTP pyrophosphatase MutT (NUDIX family)
MKEWVLIYPDVSSCGFYPERVLLIEKNRPDFQRGRFNLIGGKIEEGETWAEAALRELQEESGLEVPEGYRPVKYGEIVGSGGKVHCVKVGVHWDQPQPRAEETELVSWHDWDEIRDSPKLMCNLRVIIPFFITGVIGWVICDEGPSSGQMKHSFMVTSYPPQKL